MGIEKLQSDLAAEVPTMNLNWKSVLRQCKLLTDAVMLECNDDLKPQANFLMVIKFQITFFNS